MPLFQGFAVDADSPSLCSRRRSGAELRESGFSRNKDGFSPRSGNSPAKKKGFSSSGVVVGSPYWVEPGLSVPSSGQALANVY